MRSTRRTLENLLDPPSEHAARRALAKPAAMVVLAFACGAGLLGLAGWFIAASAVAGLAVASTFSFLIPSAGVQALAWARTLCRYGERITTHQSTLDLAGSLRSSLFARALRLPRERVAQLRSSELLGRIMVDSDAVENLLLRSSYPLLVAAAALIGTGAVFALVSPILAIIAAVGIVLSGAIPMVLAHHRSRPVARRSVAARARARQTLIETLDGLPELRSFGAEQRAAAVVTAQLDRCDRSLRQLGSLQAGGRSLGTLLSDLTLLAVVAAAAGALGADALSAPSFVAVCLVAITAFEAVVGLPDAVAARAKARAAGARLVEAFGDEGACAATTLVDSTWPVAAQIRLEGGERDITLRAGDTVLLTGAAGTGKSTVLRAIGGRATERVRVVLAGVGAADIDHQALSERVTLVAQDAHVFDGTIRENLQLADPDAGEDELCRALAAAALDDTVAAFPAGLDTPVGPGGAALSGGQRRRLSVAQGLLRRSEVLLLDEPTEGVDTAAATRLLAGVRAFDPAAALVIALHDRQAPELMWTPTARVALGRA